MNRKKLMQLCFVLLFVSIGLLLFFSNNTKSIPSASAAEETNPKGKLNITLVGSGYESIEVDESRNSSLSWGDRMSISAHISGDLSNATLVIGITNYNTENIMDLQNDENVTVVFNGSTYTRGFNQYNTSPQSFSINVGELDYDTNYNLSVKVHYKVGKRPFMLLDYVQGWYTKTYENIHFKDSHSYPDDYYLQIAGHEQTSSGVYYSKNEIKFSWKNGHDAYKVTENTYMVYADAKVSITNLNTSEKWNFDNGSSFNKGDGYYSLDLYLPINDLSYTMKTIYFKIDSTSPQPIFSTNPSGNIYRNNTSVKYVTESYETSIVTARYSRKKITVNEVGIVIGETVESNINFESGKTLTENGLYTFYLCDLLGNSSTTEIMVINNASQYNQTLLKEKGYFKADNYKVKIPYLKDEVIPTIGKDGKNSKYPGTYSNAYTYYFASYENALEFMSEIEMAECVVVSGNNSWRYKQKNNANAMATYTNADELKEVIKLYAANYVTSVAEAVPSSSIYIDSTIIVMDKEVYAPNTKFGNCFIGKNYVFSKFTHSCSASKTYTYTSLTKIKITKQNGAVIYNGTVPSGKLFSEYVGTNSGLFTITETDSVENTFSYSVYYDVGAPTIKADYEYYQLNSTKTESNIIKGNKEFVTGLEIDTNLKSFSISSVQDVYDDIVTARVELPDGTTIVTRDISNLRFGVEGYYEQGGEYHIKVYDRSLNVFEYVFSIAGAAPQVTSSYKGFGDNKMLNMAFANGSVFSSITDFTIFRYDVALPKNGVYEERVDNVLVNSVTINQNVWSYSFFLGGEYSIRFIDSFNRVTISETIKFTKGLPTYTIDGVSDGGKTNKSVSITFENKIGYELYLNGVKKDGFGGTTTNGYKIEIPASVENNGKWDVSLYIKSDNKTRTSISFIMDTIPPTAAVITQDNQSISWGSYVNTPFKLDWDVSEGVAKAKYSITNGYTKSYSKGFVMTEDGAYTFTISDDVGNSVDYFIELDSTVNYKVVISGPNYNLNGTTYVKQGFSVSNNENITMTIYRDGEEISGKFTALYSTAGSYKIVLTDYIGNIATEFITIDQTAPQISFIQDADLTKPVKVSVERADVEEYKILFNSLKQTKELNNEMEFVNWGSHSITVSDKLGNSASISFDIAKIPPKIQIFDINGTELLDGSTTNQGIYFTWDDANATAKIFTSDKLSKVYTQNSLMTDEGVYSLTVTDAANNKVSVSISVVKVISYSFKTASDRMLETKIVNDMEKTAEGFALYNNGELFVSVKKDGIEFPYVFGQQITLDGTYYFHISDALGNYDDRTITVDTTAPKLSHTQGTKATDKVSVALDIQDVATVTVTRISNITKTTEYFPEKKYEFKDWGSYTITAFDAIGNSSMITFIIEKLPPEISFETVSGLKVKNGDLLNEGVIIKYSEELIIKYSIDDSYSLVYKPNDILNAQGKYLITITDLAENVFNFNLTIDSELKYSVIVDATTIKDFSDKVVGRRYIQILINEQMTVFLNDSETPLTETLLRYTDEGKYKFVLTDKSKNSITIIFEIDHSAPNVSIDSSTTTTKSDVVYTVEDLNDVASYRVQKDGANIPKYILGTKNIFDDEGEYIITVFDYLGNKRVTEFEIKRSVKYKLDIANGFITSGTVTLELKESNVKIEALLNGEVLDLKKVDRYDFTQAGQYEIMLTDSVGNVQNLNFTLDGTKYRKSFQYNIPLDCVLTLKKDGKDFDINEYISGDVLTVKADGDYELTMKKDGAISSYNFIIDTVIPELILNGETIPMGTNIETLKKDIVIASSKSKSNITLYYNDQEVDYNKGDELTAPGHYKVVITDEVGNKVEYEFDRAFTFNKGAIVFFIMLGVAVVLVIVLVIRHRLKMRIT